MIRFVTGTDTGVGKTVASAVLAHQALAEGRKVRYVKPVQTGLAPGEPGDADFVAAAADVETAELIRLPDPLAPAVAADSAGVTIDIDSLAARIRELDTDMLLVEGAGGVLVPLTETATMADLAAALRADLVVVTRPGLGTLNHTALTLEAAAHRALAVAGLVVCSWPARPGAVERTNFVRLRSIAPILAVVRRIRGLSVDGGRAGPLREALAQGTALAAPR